MVTLAFPPTARVEWQGAIRIIGSRHPPIDLFEDIADPEDWPLLIAMEMRTNPRILDQIGTLDMVPKSHRVSGPGSTYLMAPFTHASTDRPSRFSDGSFGVLYAGDRFEVALFETVHHQARFMASTKQAAGWATQFQEIVLTSRPIFMTCVRQKRRTRRPCMPTTTRKAGGSGTRFMLLAAPGSFIPACDFPRDNAPPSSFPTWAVVPGRPDISIITGTGRT